MNISEIPVGHIYEVIFLDVAHGDNQVHYKMSEDRVLRIEYLRSDGTWAPDDYIMTPHAITRTPVKIVDHGEIGDDLREMFNKRLGRKVI